jgi:hypothetical protein
MKTQLANLMKKKYLRFKKKDKSYKLKWKYNDR